MSCNTAVTTEVTCRFLRRLYRSDDESFCVGRYIDTNAPSHTCITLVGANLPEIHFPVTYSGEWINNERFGRQFRVECIVTQLPDGTEDIIEMVTSMKVGIGKSRIKKMIALVGAEQFWSTLLDSPETFLNVSGITEKTVHKLKANVDALRYQKDLIQYFHGDLKLSSSILSRLIALYKDRLDEMLPDLRHNPFLLQQIGVPFLDVDYFCSKNTTFAINDNRRLTAATIQALLDAQGQAHVCLPAELMPTRMRSLLAHYGAVPQEDCQLFLENMLDSRFVTKSNGMFYLTRAFQEEQYVADAIAKKLRSSSAPSLEREKVDEAIREYGKQRKNEKGEPAPIVLHPAQADAVYTALTNRFCVITGGPGTGKSTILDAILYCWRKFRKDDDWLLMAPTGKAAVRMTQATGQSAGTIHSTLGLGVTELPLDPEAPTLQPNEVEQGLVIVDETSMLDLTVMTTLMKAVKKPNQHLVLVGDPDQLPSVGYGNVLADLIRSNAVPVAKLTTIYRQAAGNPIIVNSAKMRDGDVNLDWSHHFFKGYNQGSDEANMRSACAYFMRCVNRLGIKNVAMLSPYHTKTAISTNALNDMIQDAYNPDRGQGSIKAMGRTLRNGDRVIQLKNTPTAANGDVGTIQSVNERADADEPCVVVKFDADVIKEYTKDELNQLELAYAMSVHKSQGSQYPCVIMVLPQECSLFLRRDIVYTGATRASSYLAFFGPLATLQYAIKNFNKEQRYTALVPSLQNQH